MMRTRNVGIVLGTALLAACSSLSHPLSDDGADSGNPTGHNPGAPVLYVTIAKQNLQVGDTISITGTLNGATLANTGQFHATPSDSSVVTVGGMIIFARSVGNSAIDVSYAGYSAGSPLGVSVSPSADGISAVVSDLAPGSFVPAVVSIKPGNFVRFALGREHDLVFDAQAGAPAGASMNSATGTTVSRQFSTAGSFSYHCSLHGEGGVVNVAP